MLNPLSVDSPAALSSKESPLKSFQRCLYSALACLAQGSSVQARGAPGCSTPAIMDYYWGTPGLWFGDQQDPGPWFGDQQDWSIPGRVWTPHHPQLPVHGAHVGDADVEVADYDVNYDEIVETNIAEEIFQTAKEAMARILSVAHHADWQLMPFQGIKETCLILKLTLAYCHP